MDTIDGTGLKERRRPSFPRHLKSHLRYRGILGNPSSWRPLAQAMCSFSCGGFQCIYTFLDLSTTVIAAGWLYSQLGVRL